MANKRQRKKQQKQQTVEKLRKIGLDERKARAVLRDKERLAVYEKELRKREQKERQAEKRRRQEQERSRIMREKGIKVTGKNRNVRGWSEKRFNEWIAEQTKPSEPKQPVKRKNGTGDKTLLIFWRDKTSEGYADKKMVHQYMKEYRHVNTDLLLDNIRFYLTTTKPIGAEIGTYSLQVVDTADADDYINFMGAASENSFMMSDSNEWILVYRGKAIRYGPLINAVHTIVRILYDTSERAGFIMDLITKKLAVVNPSIAKRLAKDVGLREV